MDNYRSDYEAIQEAVKWLYNKGGYPSDYKLPPDLKETSDFVSFNNKTGDRHDVNSGYSLKYINQTEEGKSPYYCLKVHVFSHHKTYYGYGSLRESKKQFISEADRKRLLFEAEQRRKEEAKRELIKQQETRQAQEKGQNQIYAKINCARPINVANSYLRSHGLTDWANSVEKPLESFGDKLCFVKENGAFEDDRGNIIVPLYDENDNAVNYQTIFYDRLKQDKQGNIKPGFSKVYLKGVQTDNRHAQITKDPNDNSTVFVCEGWATGMAISLCTNKNVLCAMSCGQIENTVNFARDHYKKVVVVADNDRHQWLGPSETFITKDRAMRTDIETLDVPESEKHAWRSQADCLLIIPDPDNKDANDFWHSGQNLKSLLEAAKYYAENTFQR